MKITIRTATEKDFEGVEYINRIIDYRHKSEFIRESILGKRVEVSENIDGSIIGYSLYQELWGNTLFLTLVKVLPEYQGKKIGTNLIENFEELAKNLGYREYISSTELTNILSQKFHAKLGFKRIGILKMPHGKEVFYKKNIFG